MMEYKGYIGSVIFDDEARILHGRVANTKDVITFEGESVEEIRQAFRDSVDDYLEFCADLGEEPEKPMSGKFNVRIKPRLHAVAVAVAQTRDMSLNTLVESAIEQFVEASSVPSEAVTVEHSTGHVLIYEKQIYPVPRANITKFEATIPMVDQKPRIYRSSAAV